MNRLSSSTRRNFLKALAGTGIVAALNPLCESVASQSSALPDPEHRKLILVLFGGGVRSMDTIDDPEHRLMPHLWKDLIPKGTLFTNMRVEHLVVHPNCNASIKTGHWEYDDLDWSKPPKHPTIFEIYRKERTASDTAAWSFVYASILTATGEIDCAHYGSWSRCQDALRRTDELTWRLWREVETLPDYQGKTLMLILPDHGRELERHGTGGFIHHSDFYQNKGADEGCRRSWMLAPGPGVPDGRTIGRPVPITAAAVTGLKFDIAYTIQK
jgi:hypothetical protein